MNFFNKLSERSGNGEFSGGLKYTVFENIAYFEGITSLKSFTREKIELTSGKINIIISGTNLKIKKMCRGDFAVCGNIFGVNRE